ncbi:MAG: hydratase [Polaromonas sp.]|uniref:2-keto-4-pentenoate hydratase n=1 Tax=Polaromonas sp. TaxID=1869339 RepID=UPI003267CF80
MNTPASHPDIQDLVADVTRARLQVQPLSWSSEVPAEVPLAYATALAVRAARSAGGERPVGYKVGFTNRTIWPRYEVYGPIWGTVWHSTLTVVDESTPNEAVLSLQGLCEPRIEPEVVFCLREAPPPGCSLAQLVAAVDWVAHGYEIVHTHFPAWKFTAAQAVADGGLHGLLLVGHPVRLEAGAAPEAVVASLAGLRIKLYGDGVLKDEGTGANVLDGPVQALLHFVNELRATPGAPALQAGDLITTGTLTDAWPVEAGQTWHSAIEATGPVAGGLKGLTVRFE